MQQRREDIQSMLRMLKLCLITDCSALLKEISLILQNSLYQVFPLPNSKTLPKIQALELPHFTPFQKQIDGVDKKTTGKRIANQLLAL